MNTGGHGWIAEEAGLPVLVAALEARGQKRPSLNAFLLGNWITDVHQIVDPVMATPARFREALGSVMAGVKSAVLLEVDSKDGRSSWKAVANARVTEALDEFEAGVEKAIDAFFEPTDPRQPATKTDVRGFDAIKTMFRVTGYFKFVAPMEPPSIQLHEPKSGYRMNVDAYFRVFEEMFDQYWPHEHMDRPEILPVKTPSRYRSEIATGPKARRANISPDLYEYLREDIEIAAGSLAEIERSWARPVFDEQSPIDTDSEAWNVWLARLGRALHAVEDFFAHTNFVEHAVSILGGSAIPKASERSVYARRLIRLDPKSPDDPPFEPESEVVSGYFDFTDALFSLVHNLEEVFGLHYRDPFAKADDAYDNFKRKYGTPNKAWFEAQKMLHDVSEWIDDPEAAAKNPQNQLTKKLEKEKFRLKGPPTAEQVRRLLVDIPVFRDAPDAVKHDIVAMLVLVHGVTDVGITVYRAYKNLREFIRFLDAPSDYIAKWLGETIHAAIKDAMVFYAREWLHSQLGARRIGSHSLMNHDAKEAVLFDEAMHLAAAVNWYVMAVMTRRLHGLDFDPTKGWAVDWLDLLEYFLRHPQAEPGKRIEVMRACVPIVHVVDNRKRADTLATLAKLYAPTACKPGEFTWRTIADALYGTEGVPDGQTRVIVNRTIAAQGKGYKVKDGINYAWKPGVEVLIPTQRFDVPLTVLEPTSQLWWRTVLSNKNWTKVRGGPDPDSQMSVRGEGIDHAVQRLSPSEVEARITAANAMLVARRKAYGGG